MGAKDFVKEILIRRENRRYAKLFRDKKISYGDWITALEAGAEGEPAGESKRAQGEPADVGSCGRSGSFEEEDSTGGQCGADEFVVICAGKGLPASGLNERIGSYFASHPEVLLLYGDEDVWEGAGKRIPASEAKEEKQIPDEGQGKSVSNRKLPWFKPDWSPDLLDSCFYFGSVTAMRKILFRQASFARNACYVKVYGAAPSHEAGGDFRPAAAGEPPCFLRLTKTDPARKAEFYEAEDFEAYEKWMHLCALLAGGYAKGSRRIGHMGRMMFHCGSAEEQDKFLRPSAYLKECREALVREFRVRYAAESKPLISVVILSKDHPDVLEKCLRGCETAAGGQGGKALSYEVILVDNGSSAKNRGRVEALVQKMKAGHSRMVYLYRPQAFNFSKLCNMGAAKAEGRFLLFLNDDVELCQPGCMEWLAALADRPWTGAVGMKLYYPDSVRIQHAGITNLPMGPVHKLQFLEDDKCYYYGANRGRRNVLAVTAACLMTAKEKYLEAGGFAEELPVAFNDVDFCFRLYELGYHNVCVNDGYAYHHESLSRGEDEAPHKLERMLGEREKLYARHPMLEGRDPYYSVYLNREGLDVGIRPAYLTAGNRRQRFTERLKPFSVEGYRQDACLLVRVEDCRSGKIAGYGVVLGDNNACYERRLLFRRLPDLECRNAVGIHGAVEEKEAEGRESAGPDMIYEAKLAGQYRPDLDENMPDQVNVGLCGFLVEAGAQALPEGRYRLGMAVKNRVTGLRIVNWSNRILEM